MSSGDYISGNIANYLKQSKVCSQENGDIVKLFDASKNITQLVKPAEDTETDKTQVKPIKSRKKPDKYETNAERRIYMKPYKECVQKRNEHDSRTIFVGNVPLTTSKKDLLTLFRKCGKVESVRFRSAPISTLKVPKKVSVIMKDFNDKRSTCNAYVVFVNAESVQEAIQLNNTELNGNHLRVDLASRNKKHSYKFSVFVGNLPFDIEAESLRSHFEVCGTIEDIRLVRDSKTLQGKGFGYVTFQESSSVEIAVSLDGKKYLNRELRVERSVKKKKVKPSATDKTKKSSNKSGGKQKPKGKETSSKLKESKRQIVARKLRPNKPKDNKAQVAKPKRKSK